MPFHSRWVVDIPLVPLQSYIFGSAAEPLPDLPAFVDAERPQTHVLSCRDIREWSKRLAVGLRKLGFNAGDRVLSYSSNHLLFPVAFLGTVIAGGIFTGANPNYHPRELAHQLRDSGARLILSSDENLERAIEAAEDVGLDRGQVYVFDDKGHIEPGQGRAGCQHWSHLFAPQTIDEAASWKDLSPETDIHDTIVLNYSSGTTGLPKGVEISHYNYVSNTCQTLHIARQAADYEINAPTTKWLCFLPMYHALAQSYLIVNALCRRNTVYIMRHFELSKMLACIDRFKITEILAVPPVVVSLAKHPEVKEYNLSSVRSLVSAAAPLGRDISVAVESLWNPPGSVNVKQAWGMTEITCTAAGWHPDEVSTSNAVGELAPNVVAQVMSNDGLSELGQNEIGELWIRAPNVMKGYWNNATATRETKTTDGWLKTGDIARIDELGKIYIVDRKKELIKVKGHQVAPAELEALLLDHPDISDAAVIGITREGEELPRAFVVRKQDQTLNEKDVVEFISARAARYKRLSGGVVFVDTIPKNPSGKIMRKALRALSYCGHHSVESKL